MQESFWWWQCSDRYIISPFPHLHTPSPFSPALIRLVVSVDVKHHVYLLTVHCDTATTSYVQSRDTATRFICLSTCYITTRLYVQSRDKATSFVCLSSMKQQRVSIPNHVTKQRALSVCLGLTQQRMCMSNHVTLHRRVLFACPGLMQQRVRLSNHVTLQRILSIQTWCSNEFVCPVTWHYDNEFHMSNHVTLQQRVLFVCPGVTQQRVCMSGHDKAAC